MLRSNGEMRKVLACFGESDCKQCQSVMCLQSRLNWVTFISADDDSRAKINQGLYECVACQQRHMLGCQGRSKSRNGHRTNRLIITCGQKRADRLKVNKQPDSH